VFFNYLEAKKESSTELMDVKKMTERSNYKTINIRSLPYFFWFIGFLFIFFGTLLLANCLIGKEPEKRLFGAFYGDAAWEWVILAFIFVIGISFFIVAKYEKITINKNVIFNIYLFRKMRWFCLNYSSVNVKPKLQK
jgi:hypothetical protein